MVDQLIEDLREAAWLVVAGASADPKLLPWLEASQIPTLIVLPDLEAVDLFTALLSAEQRKLVDVRAHWLAAESDEAAWHFYNDARCNGPQGPEAWQEHYPNLQLQGMELRPRLSLDALLASWEPAAADGGVLTLDIEAQHLLHALSPEATLRLKTVVWQGKAASTELTHKLRAGCLNSTAAGATADIWIWRRDLMRHQTLNLQVERDQLEKERDELRKQVLNLERRLVAISTELESLLTPMER